MQVILQGSLRHFPPGELLTFICGRGQSGTLDLETAGKRARLFLDNERVVWAESSRGGDPVDAVLDALEWTGGSFTLLDSTVLPDGVKPVALEVAPLLDEAKRRVAAASKYRSSALFRIIDNPSVQNQVNLSAEELKLLIRVTAGRTFKDLATDLGMTRRDLTERLEHLEQLGLVSHVDSTEATDPGANAPPDNRRTLVGSLTPDSTPDAVFPLLENECTIGRVEGNSVVLGDSSVSSKHARILRTPDGFVVEDLKSRNGTFVNGERVTEKRLLLDGDLIRLGKVIVTFNVAREGKRTDTTQPAHG
jgi:FHA domain/Domain of unknown function (DUF4388)